MIDSDEYKYTIDIIKEWKEISEDDAAKRIENNNYKCHYLSSDIEFVTIRLISKSAWKEIDKYKFKDLFDTTEFAFHRVDFEEIDPHFEVILLNNSNKSIILNKVGFTFRGIIYYDIGSGGPGYVEIQKHKDYEIFVPDFQSEINQLLYDKKNNNLAHYQNKELNVRDEEDFRMINPHDVTLYHIDNINIKKMIDIENPIQIKPDGSFRFGLVLRSYDLNHISKICLEVDTNLGSFSSKDIVMNLIPN